MRRLLILVALITAFTRVALTQTNQPPAEPAQPFDVWLADLIHEANAKGFNDTLLQDTLVGIEPLPRVIQADRSQAELNPGLGRYLSTRLTRTNITRGREQAKEQVQEARDNADSGDGAQTRVQERDAEAELRARAAMARGTDYEQATEPAFEPEDSTTRRTP